ncbi:MAG TPA: hypothetical protein GX702_04400 [Chloroflexi bacterium]|nr:hypothetical protein [Chloroflexota bacterium]
MLDKQGLRHPAPIVAILLAALILVTGCIPGARNRVQPGSLLYNLPTTITISRGETLPGTSVRYDGMDDRGARVIIDGQTALKRRGDSLDWDGEPVPGVPVELRMRVIWYTEDQLHLVGTGRIEVHDAQPRVGTISTSSPISYSGPVAYSVDRGSRIPGTIISYEGHSEEGVRIGGIEGYPYRRLGDSIFWEGRLRDGVYIRIDVRVVQYDDRALRVVGPVTLWLGS